MVVGLCVFEVKWLRYLIALLLCYKLKYNIHASQISKIIIIIETICLTLLILVIRVQPVVKFLLKSITFYDGDTSYLVNKNVL